MNLLSPQYGYFNASLTNSKSLINANLLFILEQKLFTMAKRIRAGTTLKSLLLPVTCYCMRNAVPLFCLRSAFAIPPFQVRCKSVSKPFVGNGGRWDLHGIYEGFTWDLLWRQEGRRELHLRELKVLAESH